MALALFLVQYRAISCVIHPHLLPCFHDASSEVFFASIPQTEMVACPPRFSCRVATVHDGKQQADGGNLGKTEDGMDGWMGREDLDSQEPQDAIASAMAQKRMRVVCRYETLGQKLGQKYLFPTGTSSIPPEERPARWSTSPSMLARLARLARRSTPAQ